MILRLRIIILLLFCLLHGFGQDFPLIRYTVDDGLVQRQVMALDFDPDGVLWIGTKGGVSRFNGFDFTNFTTREGLLENEVKFILACPDYTVWIFHYNGISVINGTHVRLIRYPNYLSGANGLFDEKGRVWVLGTMNGDYQLFMIRNDSLVMILYDRVRFGYITGIRKDRLSSRIILETANRNYTIENDHIIPWNEKTLFDIKSPMVAHRTDGSSFQRVQYNSKILKYLDPYGKVLILSDSLIYKNFLTTDSNDQVWIGTEKGLFKIPTTDIFNYFNLEHLSDVWTFLENGNGTIWFGNYGTGLSYLDGNSLKKVDERKMQDPGIKFHQKNHFYPGGISGFHGKSYFNTSKGVLEYNGACFRAIQGMPEKAVYYSIWDKSENRLLFSVHERGIYSWTGTGEAELLTEPLESRYERIEAMAFDNQNRLWLGSVQGILIMENNKVMSPEEVGIGFSEGAQCLYSDTQGTLWIGNPSGLFIYRGDSVVRINHPLLNRSINAIAGGPGNRIIAGSPEGIGILEPEPAPGQGLKRVEWLDQRNYFLGGECKNNGIMVDSKSRIWIACSKGVVRIDPSFFNRIRPELKLAITEMQFYRPGEEGGQTILRPPIDSIPASKMNSVRIVWDAVDLTSSHLSPFRYKLDPVNSTFTETRDIRDENFYNLRPGRYEFSVQTEDHTGKIKDAHIAYRIQPRFYQTYAFKTILISVLVILLIFFTWWFTRLSLRRIQLRASRERELNDLRFRAITNQLSPHFTFNVLSAIGSLILTKEPMAAYDNVNKFSRMLRSLLGNPEGFMVPLRQELDFVTNYLDLEALRFPEKLNFIFNVDPLLDLDFRVPRMIIQIPAENAVKHGLSVKPDGGTLTINIHYNDNTDLVLSILDDGVGRSRPGEGRKDSNGRGLKIIQEILNYQNKTQGTTNNLKITDLEADGKPAGTLVEIMLSTGR